MEWIIPLTLVYQLLLLILHLRIQEISNSHKDKHLEDLQTSETFHWAGLAYFHRDKEGLGLLLFICSYAEDRECCYEVVQNEDEMRIIKIIQYF